jgi:plastocyanin
MPRPARPKDPRFRAIPGRPPGERRRILAPVPHLHDSMQHTPLLAAAALSLLSALSSAQTTHFVDNGPSFDFTPSALTIEAGDTVTWVWQGGLHSVYSSTDGLPNGIFGSGTVTGTVGHTFSVTFDQAFLQANPMPGNTYEYVCTIHVSLGQIGTITVEQSPAVAPYGCLNPAGSLASVTGAPAVGTTWTVSANNPLATQGAGALAFLAVASAPAAGYPCGLGLPGFGMGGTGAVGELLIDLTPPNPIVTAGPLPWPGAPVNFALPIPSLPELVGAQVYLQGMLVDVAPGAPVLFGATSGLRATLGS